ncbi:MAG: YbfB/YjiJ family MFS transporter [Actinomycetales bacterium]|nr:YbfB/YjiJ family MFS transporter [Actinomycetales bacterium]
MTDIPPDASYRRDLLIVIGLAASPLVALGCSRFAYALLLPAMRSDLGWTFTTAGLMNTLNAVGYLVGALGTAWVAARIGQHKAFVWSLVVTVLALAATAASSSLEVLLAVRTLLGIAGAGAFVLGGAITSTISRRHTAHRSAVLIGTYFAGGGVGIVASGLIVPAILDRFGAPGWPAGWLALAALAALGTAAATIAAYAAPTSPPAGAGARRAWVSGLGRLSSGYLLFGAGYIGYMTFIIALLTQVGLSARAIAGFWVVLGLAGAVSGQVWARLLGGARGGSAAAVLFVLLAVATGIPAVTSAPVPLYASGALFGLCFLSLVGAVTAAGRDAVAAEDTTAALSMLTTVFALGQVVGPWFTGVLADRTGGHQLGLGVSTGMLLVGAVLCRLQPPHESAPRALR